MDELKGFDDSKKYNANFLNYEEKLNISGPERFLGKKLQLQSVVLAALSSTFVLQHVITSDIGLLISSIFGGFSIQSLFKKLEGI